MTDDNTDRPSPAEPASPGSGGEHDAPTTEQPTADTTSAETTSGAGTTIGPSMRNDDSPATEQFERASTAPSPRAYSSVAGSPAVGSSTAQFETGANPADDFGPIPPASGPQPAVTPAGGSRAVRSAPGRKKRSVTQIVIASVVAVVLVLVIAGVGSELYLRNRLTNCVSDSISKSSGFPVEVSLSKKPIVLQWISGKAPWAELHGSGDNGELIDARVENVATSGGDIGSVDGRMNINGIALDGRAENITNDGSDAVRFGSLDATGAVTFDRVVAAGKEQGNGTDPNGQPTGMAGGIEKITGNPADQTIEVVSNFPALFMMIPVITVIKPILTDGKVTFQAVKVTADIPILSSIAIPPNFAQQIIDQVTPQMFGSFFNEVTMTNLKVTATGVDFALNGKDVRFEKTMMANSSESVDCSIV
ncbi:hypothetical protein [Gordonia sp. ABSL49_1]|uniref:hypothetical protein n=1 Tax=unclassified Gordonia (in: high G+C Gram-positive bacteria) TaxID=2657482 RepID=UPI001F0F04B0|nr:hypothetical protein [Gordonia sp. ABSL49_1]MCH5643982.1 hypothetical protein [Gordonia sp. ABSL49_1]